MITNPKTPTKKESTGRPAARPRISLVVAIGRNRAIGRDNQLLWHLPNDLKFFKKTTIGHCVIMGRKTFESIGRALPNRRNIVITRQENYTPEGAEAVPSIEAALLRCENEAEIFIIGGAEIYRQTLPIADCIYLTQVENAPDADAYFPDWSEAQWETTYSESFPADEKHAYAYTFQRLERKI